MYRSVRSLLRFILLSFCVIKTNLFVVAQNDTLVMSSIEDVFVFESKGENIMYNVNGEIQWSLENMNYLPSLTGSVDPIKSLQLLPSVQTTSDITGGLYIQGSDNSHNLISIDGVPVYYPMHLLGFFSAFNSLHFKEVVLNKNVNSFNSNRLGASIDVLSPNILPKALSGIVDANPLSSQFTLSFPISNKMGLSVSGRYSNINLLYDRLLNGGYKHRNIKYSFYDVNLKYLLEINTKNRLFINYYNGDDCAELSFGGFQVKSNLKWSNQTTSINWQRMNNNNMLDLIMYNTSYANRVGAFQSGSKVDVMSDISSLGLKAVMKHTLESSFFSYGAEVLLHSILPQSPIISGSLGSDFYKQTVQESLENTLFASYDFLYRNKYAISLGLRSSCFYNDVFDINFDPNVSVNFVLKNDIACNVSMAIRTQYLHQTGFSSNGLPTEFWFASNDKMKEERIAKFNVGFEKDIKQYGYTVSIDLYSAYLKNQVEFGATALDLITDKMNVLDHMMIGKGFNYGLDLMLQKKYGDFSWWLAYSFSQAPRMFENNGLVEKYQSANSRMHDMKIVGIWNINDKWTCSSSFVYASGTPYTGIKSAMVLGENVLVNFDKHNGCKYPDYHRLDLSLQYELSKKNSLKKQQLAFSLNNATFAKNPIAYKYNKIVSNKVVKEAVYVFTTAVPSLSYCCYF